MNFSNFYSKNKRWIPYPITYVLLLSFIISIDYLIGGFSSSSLRFIVFLIVAIPYTWILLLPEKSSSIWQSRMVIYSLIGLISLMSTSIVFNYFEYVDATTNGDNIRYFLSALIQSEAAIVAIVITLSLVVVQQTSSSYSTRVIEVFKSRNPDFWILLLLYILSMIYELAILINIEEDLNVALIFNAYFFGIFALFALVPYMWNTIDLLKPTRIIQFLSEDITKRNITSYILSDFDTSLNNSTHFLKIDSDKKKNEDPLLPIVDIITMSLMKYDYETAREGMLIIEKKSISILKNDDIDDEGYKKILNLFEEHFYNIGKMAVYKDDIRCADLVLKWLSEVTIILVEKQMDIEAITTCDTIAQIGKIAAEQKNMRILVFSIRCMEIIYKISFENNMKYLKRVVAISLSGIAESIAENKIRDVDYDIINPLYEIIKKAFEEEPEERYVEEYEDEFEEELDELPDDLAILALKGICRMGQIMHEKNMSDEFNYILKIIKVIGKIAEQHERGDVIDLTSGYLENYSAN